MHYLCNVFRHKKRAEKRAKFLRSFFSASPTKALKDNIEYFGGQNNTVFWAIF
jgi:hypothetical protein